MNTYTATTARANLYSLIDQTHQSHKPIHITGKRGNAVLIAEDDWSAIAETLHLLSIPGMGESIIEGMKTPLGQCDEDLEW